MVETNRSAPTATIVPVLVYEDVDSAIDFLCGAFGLVERLRACGRDGRVNHAQLSLGDGAVIIGRAGGPFRTVSGEGTSHVIHVTVPDVQQHYERARSLGARIVHGPSEMPFGELQYTAEDPGRHWWTFSQH